MIYLTFDSNIWIYSLDESWKIENQLDYLEPWIEDGTVTLLLPEIIIKEWANNRSNQVALRKRKLLDFFQMAEEILPSAFFADYKTEETQETIISLQLDRIDKLINEAQQIHMNLEIQTNVVQWGIEKKAPMHKKSSVADAIIILSLFDFAEKNKGNQYYFISSNTEDFYKKENGKTFIHPDLITHFDQLNIIPLKHLAQLIRTLIDEHNLPLSPEFDQKRKERIKNKIKERIYNPEYEQLLNVQKSQFLNNVETIDFILKSPRPTKEQVIFVLALIDSDIAYEREFYSKLDNDSWFNILKSKGVFDPRNNPSITLNENTPQSRYWEPLNYLKKISLSIKEGKLTKLVDEILEIIKSVSQNPKDNYLTWTTFIEILSNLPNQNISKEILNFMPIWLKGIEDNMLQSYAIYEKLLPKFYSEECTPNDFEKGELILGQILKVDEKLEQKSNRSFNNSGSFRPRIYLFGLTEALIGKELIQSIGSSCSISLIINLAAELKKLLFDFPEGINFKICDSLNEYQFVITINDQNLKVSIENLPNFEIKHSEILDFENLNQEETIRVIKEISRSCGIDYVSNKENDFNIEIAINALFNGSYYSFKLDSIFNFKDEYFDSEDSLEVFALIFRDLINVKIKHTPDEVILLLQLFCFDAFYRLPFFKRIVLYIISENWSDAKIIFWELVKDTDSFSFFSNHSYKKELYELLKANCKKFTSEEIEILELIINHGPQIELDDKDPDYPNYWRLEWYSALKEIAPFNLKYNELSSYFKITSEHFEDLGVVRFRNAYESPLSVEQLLEMNNSEIIIFLNDFKPEEKWEGANIQGLISAFGEAVQKEPNKFLDELDLYTQINYQYAYSLLNGLWNAGTSNFNLNWINILNFCKSYIIDNRFFTDGFRTSEYYFRANSDLLVGIITNLLDFGLQSSKNSINEKSLPLVKEIVLILAGHIKPDDKIKEVNSNLFEYSINSTTGKVLRTLLNYSIRKANSNKTIEEQSWEPEVKAAFEKAIEENIIEAYFFEGKYFYQLLFMDNDWITEKAKINIAKSDREWLAFFEGYVLNSPPSELKTFYLMKPFYERILLSENNFERVQNHGLIRHLVAFFLWGFENINSDGILKTFLLNANASSILEFLNFLVRQNGYIKSLGLEKEHKIQNLILDLWQFIIDKYKNPKDNNEEKVLAFLPNLLDFDYDLNVNITDHVLYSAPFIHKGYFTRKLIKNLLKQKLNIESKNKSKFIGKILNSISSQQYFSNDDKININDLLSFLYETGERETADDICNNLSKQGHTFIREIYRSYMLK